MNTKKRKPSGTLTAVFVEIPYYAMLYIVIKITTAIVTQAEKIPSWLITSSNE